MSLELSRVKAIWADKEFVCENKASVPSPKCAKKYGRVKVNTDVVHSDLHLRSGKQ